jgi:hypothetical protein
MDSIFIRLEIYGEKDVREHVTTFTWDPRSTMEVLQVPQYRDIQETLVIYQPTTESVKKVITWLGFKWKTYLAGLSLSMPMKMTMVVEDRKTHTLQVMQGHGLRVLL